MEPTVVSLHIKDEVDEPGRPLAETAIPCVAVEVQQEYDAARGVIDARDALEAPVARGEAHVFVVRVDAYGERMPTGCGNTMREPRELPDHRDDGQGSRLAMISLTEKSAAAMTESAAP